MSHRIFIAAVLCAAVAMPAIAQDTPRGPQPQGLWGAFSLGFAGTKTDCSNCTDPGYVGNGSTIIEVGGTISRHVRLGAEFFGWDQSMGDAKGRLAMVMAATRWYPDGSLPFYLKFGFGVSNGVAEGADSSGTEFSEKRTGLGIMIGLGWDLRVARNFSVTLTGGQYSGLLGDFVVPAGTAQDLLSMAYVVGLGVTIH
jgi:hypothetical protein